MAVLLIVALAPAICEELAFRGFVLSGLRRSGSTTAAIVISSLFFGITHAMNQQSLSAVLMGIVLGFIGVRTNSLLPCAAFHFTNNGLSVMVSRLAIAEAASPQWLDWIVRRDAAGGADFHYTTPVIITSLLLALALLWWFQRLRHWPSS